MKIKSKEQVLKEYVKRYPQLDNYVLEELSSEYDRFLELLKDCKSKEEALSIFDEEIFKNEQKFKDNEHIDGLEGSPHNQYMEIMASYGLVVFFKQSMLG